MKFLYVEICWRGEKYLTLCVEERFNNDTNSNNCVANPKKNPQPWEVVAKKTQIPRNDMSETKLKQLKFKCTNIHAYTHTRMRKNIKKRLRASNRNYFKIIAQKPETDKKTEHFVSPKYLNCYRALKCTVDKKQRNLQADQTIGSEAKERIREKKEEIFVLLWRDQNSNPFFFFFFRSAYGLVTYTIYKHINTYIHAYINVYMYIYTLIEWSSIALILFFFFFQKIRWK